jgi:mannose/cellobiose epimerase-like protein (N-acyl-D-glucosamine 2-epimerase family)
VDEYADEGGGWGDLSAYRGQNANMHMTEAMLVAFEATGDTGPGRVCH